MEEWYYALNGAQQGPVNRDVLMQLLGSGQLPADSLVWREGMGDWVAASTIPELWPQPAAAGGQQYPTPQPVLQYGVGDSAYHAAQYQFNYAGFWIRFAGAFIDGLGLGAVNFVFNFVVGAVMGGVPNNNPGAAFGILGVTTTIQISIAWLYFALMQSSSHQATLGQMATSLRVTDLNGNRLTFARATGRFFASLISTYFTCTIGYLLNLWTERKQTLHDIIAGTLVVTK